MHRLGATKPVGSSPCPPDTHTQFTSVMLCQAEVVRLCLGHSCVTRAGVWQGCLEDRDSDATLPCPSCPQVGKSTIPPGDNTSRWSKG